MYGRPEKKGARTAALQAVQGGRDVQLLKKRGDRYIQIGGKSRLREAEERVHGGGR